MHTNSNYLTTNGKNRHWPCTPIRKKSLKSNLNSNDFVKNIIQLVNYLKYKEEGNKLDSKSIFSFHNKKENKKKEPALCNNLSNNTHLSKKIIQVGLKKVLLPNRLKKIANIFSKDKEEISQKTINKLFDYFKLSEPVTCEKENPEFIIDIISFLPIFFSFFLENLRIDITEKQKQLEIIVGTSFSQTNKEDYTLLFEKKNSNNTLLTKFENLGLIDFNAKQCVSYKNVEEALSSFMIQFKEKIGQEKIELILSDMRKIMMVEEETKKEKKKLSLQKALEFLSIRICTYCSQEKETSNEENYLLVFQEILWNCASMNKNLKTEKIESKCLKFLKKNDLKLEMGKYQLILIQFLQKYFPLITKAFCKKIVLDYNFSDNLCMTNEQNLQNSLAFLFDDMIEKLSVSDTPLKNSSLSKIDERESDLKNSNKAESFKRGFQKMQKILEKRSAILPSRPSLSPPPSYHSLLRLLSSSSSPSFPPPPNKTRIPLTDQTSTKSLPLIESFENKNDKAFKSFKELGKVSRPGDQTPSSNESRGRKRKRRREEEEEKEKECQGFMIEWNREEYVGDGKGEEIRNGKEKRKKKEKERGERRGEYIEKGNKENEKNKEEEGEKEESRGEEDEQKEGFFFRKERLKMQDTSNISSEKTDLPGCWTRDDSPILTLSERQNTLSKKAFVDQFFKISPPSLKGYHPPHENTFDPPLFSFFSNSSPSSYPPPPPSIPTSTAEPPHSSLHSSPPSNFPLHPPSSFDNYVSKHSSSPSTLCPPLSLSPIPCPASSYKSYYYLKTSFKTEDILNSSFDRIHKEKDFFLTEKKTFWHRGWDEEVTVFKGRREVEGKWKEDKTMDTRGRRMKEGASREEERKRKEESGRCPCYNNCVIM